MVTLEKLLRLLFQYNNQGPTENGHEGLLALTNTMKTNFHADLGSKFRSVRGKRSCTLRRRVGYGGNERIRGPPPAASLSRELAGFPI